MSAYWQKTKLDIEGQSAFWDNQAPTYEKADMTNDNEQEMQATIHSCREISCDEIITLGGAVGCRDPKMILEDLFFGDRQREFLPRVIFNDLSTMQVQWAKEKTLKKFTEAGLKIVYLPGEIKNVCKKIEGRNSRRLIIGVYDCRSFFEADISAGYPLCGYDGYLKNGEIIGHELLMDWVKYTQGGNLIPSDDCLHVNSSSTPGDQTAIKNTLERQYKNVISGDLKETLSLQVIGRSEGRKGFFLSHWYVPSTLRVLLEEVFSPKSFTITEYRFAKGMIFIVDPIGHKPEGVVTILNNVIGNVLLDSQFETLVEIRKIIS